MKISRVTATPLNVPIRMPLAGGSRDFALSVCLAEVETSDGLTGCGLTGITEEEVVAAAINEVAGPALVGEDPRATERLWERLYWLLSPRGQTGYASHAIAALDIALWDVKARALGVPLWRLLGGARDTVPIYTTFGFAMFDRAQLAAAAREHVAQGHHRLKMVVGHHALARRDEPRPLSEVIAEDVHRVRGVRDAVGAGVELYVDANCSLDGYHARKLARQLEGLDIAFFEEPVTQNDVRLLAELRAQTAIPLAAGQNEGLAWRFRDLLTAGALDVLQPNVVITGGYTECLRVAGMAKAFNTPIANGGAWPFHNMHLHAGLAHGGLVEYHLASVLVCRELFDGLPEPHAGWLRLPDAPGLGFTPNRERIAELGRQPTSHGRGKA